MYRNITHKKILHKYIISRNKWFIEKFNKSFLSILSFLKMFVRTGMLQRVTKKRKHVKSQVVIIRLI